jgi:hypothetical protein
MQEHRQQQASVEAEDNWKAQHAFSHVLRYF